MWGAGGEEVAWLYKLLGVWTYTDTGVRPRRRGRGLVGGISKKKKRLVVVIVII